MIKIQKSNNSIGSNNDNNKSVINDNSDRNYD